MAAFVRERAWRWGAAVNESRWSTGEPRVPWEGAEILYGESFRIVGDDFEHGGEAAAKIKGRSPGQFGLDPAVIRRLPIANFEAEMNTSCTRARPRCSAVGSVDAVWIPTDRGQGYPRHRAGPPGGLLHGHRAADVRQRGFGAGLGLP
ncbi:MAG: hypothetical protein IPM94_15630 [bacterium]|nr:hypothetical protein [bacterium]